MCFNQSQYMVDEADVNGRIEELYKADPAIISPAYKLQVMMLSVLVDIRNLLERMVPETITIEKEE